MKNKRINTLIFPLVIILGVLFINRVDAQTESGLGSYRPTTSSASFYYLSKPGEVTMQVNVWGAIHNPGRYEVPVSTDLVQLISYAGGPTADAKLHDVRITRSFRKEGALMKSELFVDLDDLVNTEESKLVLYTGDTIFLDQSSWRDVLSIVTTAAVVTAAIANVIIAKERWR